MTIEREDLQSACSMLTSSNRLLAGRHQRGFEPDSHATHGRQFLANATQ
jgi:hypothetical protein